MDHSILLDRLSISYGISGSAFDWMQSFIVGCTQTVHHGGSVSRRAQLRSGIAQGSVLGPILYVLYTADVQKLVESFGFRVHLYADDTQFHDSCKSTDAAELAARAMRVIVAVGDWMSSNQWRSEGPAGPATAGGPRGWRGPPGGPPGRSSRRNPWPGAQSSCLRGGPKIVATPLHRTGSDSTQTRHSSSGSEQATSWTFFRSIPYPQMRLSTTWEFILILELLMGPQVNQLCQVCYFHLRRLRTVRRSFNERVPVDAHARLHHKPSRSLQRCPLRVEWISSRPTSIRPELGCEADTGCS